MMPLAVRPNGVEVLGLAPRLLALLHGPSHHRHAPSLARDEARILARIDRVLRALRHAKRHSVAILDTHCGRGDLLIAAAENDPWSSTARKTCTLSLENATVDYQ